MAEAAAAGHRTVAPGEVRIRRALLSVSDKRGLVEFARGLAELGVEIVSTGGTARELADQGHRDAAGRGLHGLPRDPRRPREDAQPADLRRAARGALGRRARGARSNEHGDRADRPGVREPLSVRARVGQRGVEDDEVIENIDIGGPTLIRAAAKNHAFSAVVVTPESYDAVLERAAQESDGRLSLRTRQSLALEAFALHGALRRGDRALVRRARGRLPGPVHALVREGARPHLRREPAPARRLLRARRARARTCCRWCRSCTARSCRSTTCSTSTRAGGWSRSSSCRPRRSSSTTTRAARRWARGRARRSTRRWPPIRRAPSAASSASTGRSTGRWPRSSTRCSSRWCSRRATTRTRSRCSQQKPNVRLLENQERRAIPVTEHDMKRVRGGILVQDRDTGLEEREEMQVVTRAQADARRSGASCCSRCACASTCARTRSCCRRGLGTVGIGAGQMSRVDSVRHRDRQGGRGRAVARGRGAWPPTRSSRSPTAPSWRSTPACGRSSSRAARSATTRSSRPATRPAWRWSSPPGATSVIDLDIYRTRHYSREQRRS